MTLNISIGTGSAASVDNFVIQHSIRHRTSSPLDIKLVPTHETLLTRLWDTTQTNTWSYTRFLTPYVWSYKGVSLYVDADFVFLCDIQEIFDLYDPQYAVQVVKHQYTPQQSTKYVDGTEYPQLPYARKNWSSLILFNNEKCREYYTPEIVNTMPGMLLHTFANIPDELIGELPRSYNTLVGEANQSSEPKTLHFTNGTPLCSSVTSQYDSIWTDEYNAVKILHQYEDTPVDTTSLAWCYNNRYQLLSTDEHAAATNDQALKAQQFIGINTHPYGEPVEICEVIKKHSRVEYRRSDFVIPASYVTPVDFFVERPAWNVLMWAITPYDNPPKKGPLASHAFISQQMSEKDTPYMPKAYGIDSIEIGWIAYDVLEDAIFIHHNQIPGILRGMLTPNEELWMYRYMLRQFCASQQRRPIYMPEAKTYDRYMSSATTSTSMIYQPFSRHVAKGSGFKLVGWDEFQSSCSTAAAQCMMPDYMSQRDIHLWKYNA